MTSTPILLPEILAERSEPGRAELDLRIPPELTHFAGHFPGFPILPGVVQADWAVRLAKSRIALQGGFSALENLKFQSLIHPGAVVHLSLVADHEGRRLQFTYTAAGRRFSSGRVVFGAIS